MNQLDRAWKNHLYTMDHLRSGIGLVGYAQEDPKIKYKQEGMKEFKPMWEAMEDKVTDTVFRMEETEAFQESVWVIGATRHDAAPRVTAAERRRSTNGGERQEAGADPQPQGEGRPQRPVPVRQRQEVQELPHARGGGVAGQCLAATRQGSAFAERSPVGSRLNVGTNS